MEVSARDQRFNQRIYRNQMNVYKYTTTDAKVQYLIAPDSETAAFKAAELSGGTAKLKDVELYEKGISEQLAGDSRL